MARHRSHSVEFKRQVAQEYLGGDLQRLHEAFGAGVVVGVAAATH